MSKRRRAYQMKFEKDADKVGRAGQAAMARLKKDKTWGDWLLVGEALVMGRTVAMRQAETNRPEGRAYTEIFSQWLKHYKLDEQSSGLDKSARSKIFTVMEHRPEIEIWRATLGQVKRLDLNHPVTVLRHWQKATKVSKPKPPKEPDQIQAMAAHIAELESAREVAKPSTLAGAREAYLSHLHRLPIEQWRAELEALETMLLAATNPIGKVAH
jgi:hypothetical protein